MDPSCSRSSRAAMVRVFAPDPDLKLVKSRVFYDACDGITVLSASGVSFGDSILTSATLFGPFLQPDAGKTLTLLPNTRVEVLFEGDQDEHWRTATISHNLVLPEALRATQSLLGHSSWEYVGKDDQVTRTGLTHWDLFASIAVLRLQDAAEHGYDGTGVPLEYRSPHTVRRGESCWVFSSPFGLVTPSVFHGSASQGVIANLVPQIDKPHILLTDARAMPGSEGGGVFDQDGALIALMAPTLRRISDQSVPGFSIALMIAPLFEALHVDFGAQVHAAATRHATVTASPCLHSQSLIQNNAHAAAKAVVTVRVGVRWGSGVIVSSSGYVLTNGHVLRLQSDKTSKVETAEVFVDDMWHRCQVVTISAGWMDVALLKLDDQLHQWPHLSIKPDMHVHRGQSVVAIGSGLFCPRPGCLTQTLTGGVISKVVEARGKQVMLQSSALVHQGASGGALVDATTGDFLGLITSNARHISGQIIPQINFSMPVCCLRSLVDFLEQIEDHGEVSIVLKQEIEDAWAIVDQEVQHIWNLEPPPFDAIIPASDQFDSESLQGMNLSSKL